MKPVLAALLGLFMTASVCMAQARLGHRIQRGMATQEMDAEGMTAAHPRIPANTRVKITNFYTGMEITALIVGKIPESNERIIDLSPQAALGLGIELGTGARGFVVVEVLEQVVEQKPEPEPEPEASNKEEKPSPPINLTINNYITNPEERHESTPQVNREITRDRTRDLTRDRVAEPARIAVGELPAPAAKPPNQPAAAAEMPAPPMRPKPQRPTRQVAAEPPPWPVSPPLAQSEAAVKPPPVAQPAPPPAPLAPQPVQPAAVAKPPPPPVPLAPQPVQPAVVAKPPPVPLAQPSPMPAMDFLQPVQPVTVIETPVPPPALSPVRNSNQQPPEQPLFNAPPVNIVRIIPELPNIYTGKVHRLRVGTYMGENAFDVYDKLLAAGFEVVQEQTGNLHKVYIVGIPASSVYDAAQRLGSIGFRQVWVDD